MTHKETAAHFRKRLAASGIKARCAMHDACGERGVSVVPPTPDAEFTEDEQGTILNIAAALRLTAVRGLPLDMARRTYGPGGRFYLP